MSELYGVNSDGVTETWFDGVEIPRTASTYETYLHRIPELAGIVDEDRLILDLGSGDSSFATIVNDLADSGSKVVRCDLGYATAAPIDKRRAVAASATELPFADKSFDAVVSSLLLQHLAPQYQSAAASEISRVLKPGGRAFLYRHRNTYDPEYLIPGTHDLKEVSISGLLAVAIKSH